MYVHSRYIMNTKEENTTCRACLAKTGDFININCTIITGNTEMGITLRDYWKHCMRWSDEGNMADVEHMLPEYICMQCSEDLKVSYNFLKSASASLITLCGQAVDHNCTNVNNELESTTVNEKWEILNQVDVELVGDNCEFLERAIEDVMADGEIKSFESNEEYIELDSLIEYVEKADVNDESCEIQTTIEENLGDEEPTTTLPDSRKFRIEEVDDKIEIKCLQCTQVFRTYRRFEDHMYEHRGMYPYACSMCTQRLQNVKGMVQHYTKSHGIEATLEQLQPKANEGNVFGPADFKPRTMYLCIHCSFEHFEYKRMKQHISDQHKLTNLNHIMIKLPHQCPKCLRCFTNCEKLRKHVEYEHSNIKYSTTVRIRKHVVCNKCGRRIERSLFDKHELRCCGKTKTYQCKACDHIYADRTTLMAHKRDAHPADPQADSPFRCDICGNTYRTRIQLRFHVQRHDSRNFKCNQCNRTFIRSHDLSKHQLIHTGELPYKCDACSSSYRYSHALQAHKERVHLNRLFICKVDHCKAEFRTRSQLNDHKYKHIGNPYKCEHCSKDFLRRESLRRHCKALHNVCPTEEELTKIYQRQTGRLNTHDIRKMSENQ